MAKKLLSILAVGLSSLGSFPAYSQSFAGKAVNIIVGYSAGGGYDTYSRAIARHMGTYIPGKPAMVVQNMPGAGSAKARSIHLHNRAQGWDRHWCGFPWGNCCSAP